MVFGKRLSDDQRRFRKQEIDEGKNHTQRSNCSQELRLLFSLPMLLSDESLYPMNLC